MTIGTYRMLIIDLTAGANNAAVETFLNTDPKENPSEQERVTTGSQRGSHSTQLKGGEQPGVCSDGLGLLYDTVSFAPLEPDTGCWGTPGPKPLTGTQKTHFSI